MPAGNRRQESRHKGYFVEENGRMEKISDVVRARPELCSKIENVYDLAGREEHRDHMIGPIQQNTMIDSFAPHGKWRAGGAGIGVGTRAMACISAVVGSGAGSEDYNRILWRMQPLRLPILSRGIALVRANEPENAVVQCHTAATMAWACRWSRCRWVVRWWGLDLKDGWPIVWGTREMS
ncbi:hypothetical protein C8J57DRAFT_1220627 [Mycena rebaudengoi]|nr:hypothetical protein C8J57DRAFT_1220627 [Mycena rebaudengoi]